MQKTENYKQTEVGLIPEEWEVLKIKEVASITTGGSDTQDRIDEGEFPFFVRSQKVERINKFTMDCEAILTSGDGVGVGKIFHYINGRFDFHQRVYCIYNFRNGTNGKYLFFQFSNKFNDRVMSLTAKSSVDSVRREMIADMVIPFPKKIDEQTAIASALSDMDALIAQTENLIEKKKAIKQGVMQELLTGKKRLKGFENSKGYKQTEVGVIPEDWEIFKIGQVSSITTGGSDTQDRKDEGEFPFFVRSQKVERNNRFSMDCEAILTSGDGVGVGKIFHYIVGKFDFHQRVYCIYNFSSNTNGKYLFYQFSIGFNNRVMSLTAKSSVDSVRREMISEMKIPFPNSLQEQKAIASAVSDLEQELELFETKLQKLKLQKQGMMQALLTGKIRLI